jgi:peptide/nickel transport system permease protein
MTDLATASQAAAPVVFHASRRRVGSLWNDSFRRLRRDRAALVGLAVITVMALAAIFAKYLAPYDPIEINSSAILVPPTPEHILGTDHLGRDIFSRLLFGGQLSLQIGVISVGIALSVGLILGLTAGYYGKVLDGVILRIMDVLLAFPGILFALSIIAILGPGLQNVMIAVGIADIPLFTRVVRASILATKHNLYVDAARVSGCRDRRIMFNHILPNALTSVIVLATLEIATAILVGGSLSFLGLGVQPPTPEWGNMVAEGREYLRDNWWVSGFPGLTIMVAVLAITVLGDGMREAIDPKRKLN